MSLSHFDEKSGIVPCLTPWGQWWQTVSEVFIDVNVPKGTRGKDCKVAFKPSDIECKVKNKVIFQGSLFDSVVVDDCTWTLEEQSKISILLTKAKKFTTGNLWESLLSNEYVPDAFVREQMLKKLDLEKMQVESDSGDEASSPKQTEHDAESNASGSDDEADEHNEQAAEPGSDQSAPASPAGSNASDRSEEEVHISEGEGSNHGSDMEQAENDSASEAEGSDNEAEDGKADEDGQDSDHEGSVPEINIQSEDEDIAEKADSDNEDIAEKADSDEEDNAVKADSEDERNAKKADSDEEDNAVKANSDEEDIAEKADSDEEAEMANQSDAEKNEEEGRTSPVHGEEEMALDKTGNSDNEGEEQSSPEKNESKRDAEQEGSDGEGKKYGSLVANIFGDSDDEDGSPTKVGKSNLKSRKISRSRKVISDSEDEGEKSAEEEVEVHADKPGEEEKRKEEERESDAEGDKEDKSTNEVVPDEANDAPAKSSHPVSDDDSDEGVDEKFSRVDFISDFDLMMQKKKDSTKKRKRKDVDIINDSDDLIADIISQMRLAAEDDRALNKVKKTATKKLKILPMVMSQLKKQDLKMAFLDQGILNVMAEWLAPLPDRSLPNLQIRDGMIRRLKEFPCIDQSLLKSSGVGRALMYLYKHPKETKENKEKAGKLITEWARPIFNVTTDYHALTKEEREQRDFDHIPRKKRSKEDASELEDSPENNDIDKALREGDRKIRPGEKGWIGRARVPLPSSRDYVVRPKWNVEMEFGRGPGKKPLNRFEKHLRTVQEKKKNSKALQAVTISIEGRKMAI